MGKQTTFQWLMGWQRLGSFLLILIFTILWILGLIRYFNKEALVMGAIIIGAVWIGFILGTIIHWRKLKKSGHIK